MFGMMMMVDGGGGDYNPSYFLSPESHERLLINWSFLKDKVGVKNRSELEVWRTTKNYPGVLYNLELPG